MLRYAILALCVLLVACSSPTYTRGSDDPTIDDAAMSTRLDRRDLEDALDKWIRSFESSKFFHTVDALPDDRRNIAILGIENQTSEHISSSLESLVRSFETKMVNGGVFTVVERQQIFEDAAMKERLRSLGENIDKATASALGKEFGVNYFVYGYVGDVAEKTQDAKRVQYFLFLTVTSVERNAKVFQLQVDATKLMEG